MEPISMIMGFLFSYISRKNEFAADAYSAKTANLPGSLISGLKNDLNISEKNLIIWRPKLTLESGLKKFIESRKNN